MKIGITWYFLREESFRWKRDNRFDEWVYTCNGQGGELDIMVVVKTSWSLKVSHTEFVRRKRSVIVQLDFRSIKVFTIQCGGERVG